MANGMLEHGWSAHFYAMQRWKALALEHADGEVQRTLDGFSINSERSFDYAYVFFIWAHSMRDWLINTRAIERKSLDEKLGKFDQWGMVRDLANRVKHQTITRDPVDAQWIAGMKVLGNTNPPAKIEIQTYVFHNKSQIGLAECIKSIWAMWLDVLTKAKLLEVTQEGELKCID